MTMAVKDVAWLAGLLEGEGCFGGKDMRIRMNMTDRDVVVRAATLLGVDARGPYQVVEPTKRGGSHKPVWRMAVYGPRAAGWMMTLYLFMGARRRQEIEEALAEWKVRRKRRSAQPTGQAPTCLPVC